MADHRGIVLPAAVDTKFTLQRHEPAPDLAGLVDRYWIVRWDLRGRHAQETLPYPCVNMVIGTHQPGVFGPMCRRFVADLVGRGWVVGAKFTPAGYRALSDRPIVELVDRRLAIEQALPGGERLVAAVEASACDRDAIGVLETFLRGLAPVRQPAIGEVNAIVAAARATPAITKVAELASHAGLPIRALERLFREYVGVTPKWVIRRFRIHEAAERIAQGTAIDWSALVHDLGYYDQAHFIRDFKAQLGRTPQQYAAECARA